MLACVEMSSRAANNESDIHAVLSQRAPQSPRSLGQPCSWVAVETFVVASWMSSLTPSHLHRRSGQLQH